MKDSDAALAGSGAASGIRDFQLVLLSGMHNEAMVQDALRRLGADRAEMAAIRDRTGLERLFRPAETLRTSSHLRGRL